LKVTIMAVASFLVVWGWLEVVLQFRCMQSDVARYWMDSLAWRTPFNPDYAPRYPLLIALLHFLLYCATARLPPCCSGFYLGTQPLVASALAQRQWIMTPLVVVLLASQFAYSWYMTEIFFAP
jgi:hypothetical protein